MATNPKLIDKLSSRLPPQGQLLLDTAVRCADYYVMRAFLVGGTSRDLILDRAPLDLDIAVEGDAVALAKSVADAARAHVLKSTEFGTSSVKLDDFVLDLASTRAESYARPGALPKVRPASIDADLLRRDFTMNAVAIALNGAARILDPMGGAQDIRAGQVRVLHDRSFQNDATRILRGVRYEQRFGFRFEERTYDLLQRDLAYLDTISGTRLRQELRRTFAEDAPETALARMQELGVLAAVHPALRFDQRQGDALCELRSLPGAPGASVWALLAWNAGERAIHLTRRLALTAPQRDAVLALARLRNAAGGLNHRTKPSTVVATLSPFPLAAVYAFAVMAETDAAREQAIAYLTRLRDIGSVLRGDDVIALGVARGPAVGDMLDRLRVAKLDGDVNTRADEEAFVRKRLKSRK